MADAWGSGVFCNEDFAYKAKITNCILWGNSMDDIDGGFPQVSYSNVESYWQGIGNIVADPLFISFAGYDYLLLPESPCIDSGTGDDDGIDWSTVHPRYGDFNTALPDMGAYGGPDAAGWLD